MITITHITSRIVEEDEKKVRLLNLVFKTDDSYYRDKCLQYSFEPPEKSLTIPTYKSKKEYDDYIESLLKDTSKPFDTWLDDISKIESPAEDRYVRGLYDSAFLYIEKFDCFNCRLWLNPLDPVTNAIVDFIQDFANNNLDSNSIICDASEHLIKYLLLMGEFSY